jgi:hypothetical protein
VHRRLFYGQHGRAAATARSSVVTPKAAAFSSHRGFAIGSHHDLRVIRKGFHASGLDLQARPVCRRKTRSMPASPSCSADLAASRWSEARPAGRSEVCQDSPSRLHDRGPGRTASHRRRPPARRLPPGHRRHQPCQLTCAPGVAPPRPVPVADLRRAFRAPRSYLARGGGLRMAAARPIPPWTAPDHSQRLMCGTRAPIAEYLLVLPPVRALVPTLITASYGGHQVACRLGWYARVFDVGPVASQARSPVMCPGPCV